MIKLQFIYKIAHGIMKYYGASHEKGIRGIFLKTQKETTTTTTVVEKTGL